MQQDWYRNAIYYGIDVSKFYDSDGNGVGDLRGVIEKLDYIQSLGVTCLWLLPFYPSDRRDNGYDVTEYKAVDQELGTLDDFRELVDQAHRRGLKILIELVAHHTSDQHPWFQAAISDRKSKYYDYYVWDERPKLQPNDIPAFPGEDDSVWKYVEKVDAYYHHQFYDFEPDLNMNNDDVWVEIKDTIDFWISLDVDGFRVDAATHMINEECIPGAGSRSGRRLDELRAYIDSRKKEAILLGEADVVPERMQEYFGDGDRLHILYNFLLNADLFKALAIEKSSPITDRIKQLDEMVDHAAWFNFIRNLDELNLVHLSQKDQQKVMEEFAPDPEMRIYGRGIRRRTAPMLKDLRRLKMAYGLMFAMPGAPMFVYGDEIGMGENLNLPGRISVRLPMQWSEGKNAGFSESSTRNNNILKSIPSMGDCRYQKVNVVNEDQDSKSLLNFFRDLVRVRQRYPQIGLSTPEIVNTGRSAIVAVRYDSLLCIHNLSKYEQHFELDVPQTSIVVLGYGYPVKRSLPPYGYSWINIIEEPVKKKRTKKVQ